MTETIKIEDMNCNKCKETITKFIKECEGIVNLDFNLNNKTLKVDFDPPATIEKIKEAIEDSGFSAK